MDGKTVEMRDPEQTLKIRVFANRDYQKTKIEFDDDVEYILLRPMSHRNSEHRKILIENIQKAERKALQNADIDIVELAEYSHEYSSVKAEDGDVTALLSKYDKMLTKMSNIDKAEKIKAEEALLEFDDAQIVDCCKSITMVNGDDIAIDKDNVKILSALFKEWVMGEIVKKSHLTSGEVLGF